ncbi:MULTISPECIES: hypothetical protein [unclassified Oceanobacillus]|nr:hypothetical protein [Oceanobacillus sp. AG]
MGTIKTTNESYKGKEIKGSGFFQKGFNGPFTESATFYFEK